MPPQSENQSERTLQVKISVKKKITTQFFFILFPKNMFFFVGEVFLTYRAHFGRSTVIFKIIQNPKGLYKGFLPLLRGVGGVEKNSFSKQFRRETSYRYVLDYLGMKKRVWAEIKIS